jgi:arylsulfatase A-like enzyme
VIENVILITVDALRADHLSCYGYHKKTTKNLDELANNGFLFTQAFSNAPETCASFPSILTSTYPLMFNQETFPSLSKERVMLSEILRKKGYTTGAFHSNPYLSSFYGYDKGFDVFEDLGAAEHLEARRGRKNFLERVGAIANEKLGTVFGYNNLFYKVLANAYINMSKPIKKIVKGPVGQFNIDMKYYADANMTNAKVISWLKNIGNHFFLWIHYMDVHMPYKPPQEYLNNFGLSLRDKEIKALNEKMYKKIYKSDKVKISKTELKNLVDLYDAEIRYVDDVVRFLLDEIAKIGLLSNTLVIVTADHGEEFLEHGGMLHASKTAKLHDELLHVPLILYAPELGENMVINDLVSLIDLAPTIVDILGIKKPEQWIGESLLPLIKGEERKRDNGIVSEFLSNGKRKTAYRTKKWKFILDEEKNAYELYDLGKDSKEKNNVAGENLDVVKYLNFKIKEHISMENKISEKVEERKKIGVNIKKLKARGKI